MAITAPSDASSPTEDIQVISSTLEVGNYVKLFVRFVLFCIFLFKRVESFNVVALVLCLIPAAFLAFKGLKPPEIATGTNVEGEKEIIHQLAQIAEEAARRADLLAPRIEKLRLLNALVGVMDADEYAIKDETAGRARRWALTANHVNHESYSPPGALMSGQRNQSSLQAKNTLITSPKLPKKAKAKANLAKHSAETW